MYREWVCSVVQKVAMIESRYYENDKWMIGEGQRGGVIGISNTSPQCPEMVQSLSAGSDSFPGHTFV
jgi:hypothetical protein